MKLWMCSRHRHHGRHTGSILHHLLPARGPLSSHPPHTKSPVSARKPLEAPKEPVALKSAADGCSVWCLHSRPPPGGLLLPELRPARRLRRGPAGGSKSRSVSHQSHGRVGGVGARSPLTGPPSTAESSPRSPCRRKVVEEVREGEGQRVHVRTLRALLHIPLGVLRVHLTWYVI